MLVKIFFLSLPSSLSTNWCFNRIGRFLKHRLPLQNLLVKIIKASIEFLNSIGTREIGTVGDVSESVFGKSQSVGGRRLGISVLNWPGVGSPTLLRAALVVNAPVDPGGCWSCRSRLWYLWNICEKWSHFFFEKWSSYFFLLKKEPGVENSF